MTSSTSVVEDRRGIATTEYVVLLGTCAIAIASAIVAWGPPLLQNYVRTQGILLGPFP
jgi:Flp pilus assembly pilin Flp